MIWLVSDLDIPTLCKPSYFSAFLLAFLCIPFYGIFLCWNSSFLCIIISLQIQANLCKSFCFIVLLGASLYFPLRMIFCLFQYEETGMGDQASGTFHGSVWLWDLRIDSNLFHSYVKTYQPVICPSFVAAFKITGVNRNQAIDFHGKFSTIQKMCKVKLANFLIENRWHNWKQHNNKPLQYHIQELIFISMYTIVL